MNINCPACDGSTKVIETRKAPGGTRRRIECKKCSSRFTTLEQIVIDNNRTKGTRHLKTVVDEEIQAKALLIASRYLADTGLSLLKSSVAVLNPESDKPC